MAKPIVEAPRAWVDETEAGSETQLARLFRAVAEPEPLSASALAEVQKRLAVSRYATSSKRRVRELTLAFVMLLTGSSLAVAGWGASEWWTGRHAEPALKPSALPALAPKHDASRIPSPTLDVEQGLSASPEAASEEPKPQTAAKAAPAADRGSSLPALANSSALAAEAQALQQVLVKLRREHDATGALALLDEAQPLFLHGTLALEAQVARVDALLLLSRQGEALQILEQLPFAQVGRGAELRLVRAELRALGDCGRAISDFDVLVSQSLAPALMERALYGRAACELQLGEQSQAERDFKQYLAHFPQGRFAERVQSQLAPLSRKVP